MTLKPITREDMYYSYLINGTGSIPKPITRKEQYLYYLCANGFGNGGGTVTPEAIDDAVERYLTENPIDSVNLGNLPEATEITETDKLLLGQDAQNKSIEMSGFMDFMRENGLFDLDGKGRPLLPGYGIVARKVIIDHVKGGLSVDFCTIDELLGEIPIENVVLCSATVISDKSDNSLGCYIDIDRNAIRGIWDYGPTITVSDIKVAVTAIYKKPVPFEPGLKTVSLTKILNFNNIQSVKFADLSEFGISNLNDVVSASVFPLEDTKLVGAVPLIIHNTVYICSINGATTYLNNKYRVDLLVKDYSSIGPSIVTEGIRVITREVSFKTFGSSQTTVLTEADLDVNFDDIIAVDYKSNSLDGYTGYAVLNTVNRRIELITRANTGNGATFTGTLFYFVKVPVVEQKLKPFTKDVEVTLGTNDVVSTGIHLNGSDDVNGFTFDNFHSCTVTPLDPIKWIIGPVVSQSGEVSICRAFANQTGPCKIRIHIE